MSALRSRAWLLLLAAGALASALFVVAENPWLQAGLQIGAYAASAAVLTAGWWRRRSSPDPLLTLAVAGFGLFLCANVGGAVWPLLGTVPVPSPLDALFLGSYALFALALWRLGSRSTGAYRSDLLDTSVVALGVAPLLWLLVVDPILRLGDFSPALLVYLGYPLSVFVLFAMSIRLAFVSRRPTLPHLLLGSWIALELLADLLYLRSGVTGTFAYGQWWQALWLLSATCAGAMALHPRAAELLAGDAHDVAKGRRRLYLLGAAVAVPLLTLGLGRQLEARTEVLFVAGGLLVILLFCVRMSGLMVDLVEQRRVQAELEQLAGALAHQALHDPLTGLGNRRLFNDRLDHALAQRPREAEAGAAVVLLDIDGFKTINDTFGHGAGDQVLVEVARRLNQVSRQEEEVFRLGGDEFAVVLESARLNGALHLADRITNALNDPLDVGPRQIRPLGSLGVAIALDGQEREALLAEADLAMFAAKREGAHRPVVFDAPMHLKVLDRHQMERDLREAVERDELRLLYQPLIHLPTNELVGVEALLRWDHPDRGRVSPVDFIPLAESTGAILGIGDWVLTEACAQLARWDAAGLRRPLRMSVNVSPRQLADPEFVGRTRDILHSSALDPARITLEVTEAAFGFDTETMIERVHRLKALGVRLAIDDFGTGYSSLSQLRRLPVDILKIDRSFVAGIAREPAEWALTTAIVRLAASLGTATLAEGIENGGHLAHLRSLNVEFGQGYLFSPPLPAEQIPGLLASPAAEAFAFE